jgi:hypothetical protein
MFRHVADATGRFVPAAIGPRIRRPDRIGSGAPEASGPEAPARRLVLPTSGEWVVLACATVILFVLRLPFLPPTLDDIDAINFDLGIHDYDPAAHRPHPPGYPVFILLAKMVHVLVPSHAAAIALVSAGLGSLSIVPLYLLARTLLSRRGAALATVLTLVCPLVWFNSVRPMSDTTGLFFVLTSQLLLMAGVAAMGAGSPRNSVAWFFGIAAAGLAMGVRLQAAFLVGPVLLFGAIRLRSGRTASAAWLTAALLVWLVPVLILSGGIEAYLGSFSRLLADALPAESLVSAPTLHRAANAAWDTVASPWGPPWISGPMLLLAAVGFGVLWSRDRSALGWVLLLSVPYAVYHVLLQNTPTLRYAIPVVPLISLLAAAALTAWRGAPRALAPAAGTAFCALAAAWTLPALAAYSNAASPAEQALDRLRSTVRPDAVVVAGHHVFARYLASLREDFTVLRSNPGQVPAALADYWKRGEKRPVHFLRDPQRLTLQAVAPGARVPLAGWAWPDPTAPFMKGERPRSVDLVRLDPPRWFAESGMFLTPEAGDPERVARAPHRVYVRPHAGSQVLMASGTRLGTRGAPITLRVGETEHTRWTVQGDSFAVHAVLGDLVAPGYVPLAFESPAPLLITDFWIGPHDRLAVLPAEGFFTPERDESARRFRWIGPEARVLVYLPRSGARLRVRGQVPAKYYTLPVTLSLRWNDGPPVSFSIAASTFDIEYPIPAAKEGHAWGQLVLSSSHRFVPHDHQRNGDRRQLAVQIFEMALSEGGPPLPARPGSS